MLDDGYTNTERLAWMYVPTYFEVRDAFSRPGLEMMIAVAKELHARGHCDELEVFSIMSQMLPDASHDDIMQVLRITQNDRVCVCNCDEEY